MIPHRVYGTTRELAAPKIWSPGKRALCSSLALRDEETPFGPMMTTAWEVSPTEMRQLIEGGLVYLTLFGTDHPGATLAARLPSYG